MTMNVRPPAALTGLAFDRWRVTCAWTDLEALVRRAEGSDAAEAIHDARTQYYEDYGTSGP